MSNGTRPRPAQVVIRDRAVAVALLEAAKPLTELHSQLSQQELVPDPAMLNSDDVYRSLWRLREQGYVAKVTTGSRTPSWGLTETGVAYAQQVQAEGVTTLPALPEPTPAVPQPPQ